MAASETATTVTEPVAESVRPLRVDAQRNRERLIAAAIETFAEEGDDVALEAVAARAGVGIGTLYRHFPNRDALVIAAYQQEVDTLCEAAEELLAGQPADRALRAWAERFTDYIATKRTMAHALRAASYYESPLLAETRGRILGAVRLLLESGAADGTLRADANAQDVISVMNGIWYLPAGPAWRETVGRMLDLVIDGLRYGTTDRVPKKKR